MEGTQRATVSRTEFARILKVGTRFVTHHINNGNIKHIRVGNTGSGRNVRILASEITDFPQRLAELQAEQGAR